MTNNQFQIWKAWSLIWRSKCGFRRLARHYDQRPITFWKRRSIYH